MNLYKEICPCPIQDKFFHILLFGTRQKDCAMGIFREFCEVFQKQQICKRKNKSLNINILFGEQNYQIDLWKLICTIFKR